MHDGQGNGLEPIACHVESISSSRSPTGVVLQATMTISGEREILAKSSLDSNSFRLGRHTIVASCAAVVSDVETVVPTDRANLDKTPCCWSTHSSPECGFEGTLL